MKTVNIQFSKHQLIHLRRFLNRGIDCAHGRCTPSGSMDVEYYTDPIMKKIKSAINEIQTNSNK